MADRTAWSSKQRVLRWPLVAVLINHPTWPPSRHNMAAICAAAVAEFIAAVKSMWPYGSVQYYDWLEFVRRPAGFHNEHLNQNLRWQHWRFHTKSKNNTRISYLYWPIWLTMCPILHMSIHCKHTYLAAGKNAKVLCLMSALLYCIFS